MNSNGKILTCSGGIYTVETADGMIDCYAKGGFRYDNLTPVPGDEVTVREEKEKNKTLSYIVEVKERKNVLIRPAVANLDVIFSVNSVCSPDPALINIDKILSVSRHNDINAVVIFTKADLDPKKAEELFDLYSKTGIEVILSDISGADTTLARIRKIMAGKLSAFSGPSGAGKSTLLNRLTDADVLAEDKLFATLDPTTRKLVLPCGETVLLTDTVGCIRKLPHHLVEAFKSTLDEVTYADVLLIVSDITDPEVAEHLEVTEGIISDLGAEEKPRIYVYNKCDKIEGVSYAVPKERTVVISALENGGIDALLNTIEDVIHEGKKECILLIPYSDQSVLSSMYDKYTVLEVDYTDSGITVKAVLGQDGRGILSKYIVE
jgi:putative ribosome biogenesis GTPase RsgA